MTVKKETGYKLSCLSTDTKPSASDYPVGTILIETDTKKLYMSDGSDWVRYETLEAIQRLAGAWWFCNHWLPSGMVNAGSSYGTGSVTFDDEYLRLATGTTANSDAYAYKMGKGLVETNTALDKRRWFGIRIEPSAATNQIIHIVTGQINSFTSPTNTASHVGFKIIDGTLYGTVGDDTTENTLNMGSISAGAEYRLEAYYIPNTKVEFYKGGAYQGELTSNLPSSPVFHILFYASISNTEAADKYIDIFAVRVYQEET